jgi:pimeloyl-ACP methyl ester carboxylesterase
LSSINIPSLLIFGEHDKVTDLVTAEKMHRKIKDSELIKIYNAGHYSNLEQPEQFNNAIVQFINNIEI